MTSETVSVLAYRQADPIEITVRYESKSDKVIGKLFDEFSPDWETWLEAVERSPQPRYVEAVLDAAGAFVEMGNPHLALLMLAYGYTAAAQLEGKMESQVRKTKTVEILTALEQNEDWVSLEEKRPPTANQIYAQMQKIARK